MQPELYRSPARRYLRIRVAANKQAWIDSLVHDGDGAPVVRATTCSSARTQRRVCINRARAGSRARSIAAHGSSSTTAKKKNADLCWSWFVTGLGEHFAQHEWDGQTLVLGAHPRLCMRDLAADALAARSVEIGA
jgi:hypothetical protein